MPIIARDSGGRDFDPAPEGLFPAVCCDVVDRGMVESQWGVAHKVQLRWQLDGHSEAGLREDGKQWLVVRQFTLSLHEKSALRGFLTSWRGKAFTSEELQGFDLERLIGAPCMIQVLHSRTADGARTFANIQNVMPLPRGIPKPSVHEYVRVSDRGPADGLPDYEPEDAIPF